MQLGVHSPVLYDRSFEEALAFLSDRGVTAVEPGVGGNPGDDHLDRAAVLDDPDAQTALASTLEEHGIEISSLATHNNPIHPDEAHAEQADRELREAIELAAQLDVNVVTCFSGLPAGGPDDAVPNWITYTWPAEHADALEYQGDVAVEYWSGVAEFADDHGVEVAIEMHPNTLVYEPRGLVRLREATNDRIGANFDPSHLYWQGISITDAIRYLGERDAIVHVHAKDTRIYDARARIGGVLDTTALDDERNRPWIFRTVGYGHGERHWKDVVSTLRLVGYDGVVSIEHEDALTSATEGLEKAIDFLSRVIFEDEPGEVYWAD